MAVIIWGGKRSKQEPQNKQTNQKNLYLNYNNVRNFQTQEVNMQAHHKVLTNGLKFYFMLWKKCI